MALLRLQAALGLRHKLRYNTFGGVLYPKKNIMDQPQPYIPETQGNPLRSGNWRALPRLLVSRQWRWVTFGVLVLALVMIRLGFWQLDRLAEKRASNALIQSRLAAPALQLTGQPIDLADNEYRHASVTGTFDNDQAVLLRNRSRDGVPGMHLLTPLRITGSNQAVLVDRGWLPLELTAPEARQQFNVAGTVQVQGIVRVPKTRTSSFGPQDRQPEGGRLDMWFRPDVGRIAQQVPYPLLPFYLEAEQPVDQAPGLPRPQLQIDLSEGPHLSYAIQWFAFTITLLGGYGALVATRGSQQTPTRSAAP
jgi:surfeit locus 1 family protein